MHFVHVLLVFSLGLGCYCSSQWANLDTQSGNNPSLPTSQNSLDDNSGITLHATAHGGGISRPESNSPEVLISNQAEEFQACSSNNDQLPPAKRQIRREWCPYNNDLDPNNLPATNTKPPSSVPEDKPKDGSEPSQLDTSGEKAPSTNINPQLQIFQGVEQLPGKLDSNPCNGPRNNPVCSPFYLSRVWYPLSLVWKATCLDFCRICT